MERDIAFAEKADDALIALAGSAGRIPEAAMAMPVKNRVILKPVLVEALQTSRSTAGRPPRRIYGELSTLSDNEEWQRKLRGAYLRRITGDARGPIDCADRLPAS